MQPSNLLKIETLGTGWRDKDNVLLHACFQLLSDFVEQELRVIRIIDWEADAETRQAKAEIEELYGWWQEWKNRDDFATESFEEEWLNYQKENEMLKRLVDVRMHLWT